MKLWNTDEVVSMLVALMQQTHFPESEITVDGPGGEYDTCRVVVWPDKSDRDEFLQICGFRLDRTLEREEWDNTEVELVMVSDGQTSDGGIASSKTTTCVAYGHIVATLRQAGFNVVRNIKDFF